jgi:alpha-glucosidase (family GH31 glycosyl hydrolase)
VFLLITTMAGTAAGERHRRAADVVLEGDELVLTEPASADAPGYEVHVVMSIFGIETMRDGAMVLATRSADHGQGPARFRVGGTWFKATAVTSWDWDGTTLSLTLATTSPDHTVLMAIRPEPDRYRIDWSLDPYASGELGTVYALQTSGQWFGQGEAAGRSPAPWEGQPWPLSSGRVYDGDMNPAEYLMTDPFWFTSKSVGLWVDTDLHMSVSINDRNDGMGRFFVKHTDAFASEVFVETTPDAVYHDYVDIVGGPQQIDATYEQIETPLWNTWAQFYTSVDQAKVIDYAEGLAAAGLTGHAVQIDDGWMPHYGDLEFDRTKFPDPAAMSDRIHRLGSDLGLWVTLWINTDSTNFEVAKDNGYFLPDKEDPSQPCLVHWWNGTAGIVDLANPDAYGWYEGRLHRLMRRYDVNGFKFDTRFFDGRCATSHGAAPLDYLTLGAQLADSFDLQGVGVRISWGAQRYGFVIREVDKCTDLRSLQAAVNQVLAISTIGYPFVETDMIGGSNSCPPPTKTILVRWAQAASLMPVMYSSTSPLGVTNPDTGQHRSYDAETVRLYRQSLQTHRRLAPYIWDRAQEAVATGEPIMKPLFFDFPDQPQWTYSLDDELLLGDAVLAAPILGSETHRDIYLPGGTWLDPTTCEVRTVKGGELLETYDASLGTTPVFVLQGTDQSAEATAALAPGC